MVLLRSELICFLHDTDQIPVMVCFQMHILNTHLSLSHEAREQSVIQIWQYVKQLHGPVVFLGDLNAEPQETAVQLVHFVYSTLSSFIYFN